MNDFLMDIKGCTAILKSRNYYKADATEKQRTVQVLGGSGCNPDPAYGRRIEVKSGTCIMTVSSYDLECVLKDGKKICQAESAIRLSDIADICPRGNPFK